MSTSPNLLSLGTLMEQDGFDFECRHGKPPLLSYLSGYKQRCKVVNRVPVGGDTNLAALAGALRESVSGMAKQHLKAFFSDMAQEFLDSEECATAVGDMALPNFAPTPPAQTHSPTVQMNELFFRGLDMPREMSAHRFGIYAKGVNTADRAHEIVIRSAANRTPWIPVTDDATTLLLVAPRLRPSPTWQ